MSRYKHVDNESLEKLQARHDAIAEHVPETDGHDAQWQALVLILALIMIVLCVVGAAVGGIP